MEHLRFNYRPEFQNQQSLHPIFHIAQYEDNNIGQESNNNENCPFRYWKLNPQTTEHLDRNPLEAEHHLTDTTTRKTVLHKLILHPKG